MVHLMSYDLTRCVVFLWGHIKEFLFVHPFTKNIRLTHGTDPCRSKDHSCDTAINCVEEVKLLPGRVSCYPGGAHRTFAVSAEKKIESISYTRSALSSCPPHPHIPKEFCFIYYSMLVFLRYNSTRRN